MRDLIVSVLKSKIPGWLKFEASREKGVRAALEAFAHEANPGATSSTLEPIVERHVKKVLDASLPLHELGADALTGLGDLLRGMGK